MRTLAASLCGLLLASISASARAQPLPNPYQTPSQVGSLEPVATALLDRAEQLLSQGQFADAKQLAVESLQLNPGLALVERASRVSASADQALGIVALPVSTNGAAGPTASSNSVATEPALDASAGLMSRGLDGMRNETTPKNNNQATATVHGSIAGATLGASLTLLVSDDTTAVFGGLAGALLGGYIGNRNRGRWSAGDTRTIGSGAMWAGLVGGLVVDVTTYTNGATRPQIAIGISLGTVIGGVASYGLARSRHYTPGEVGMIDSLAFLGGGAGLSLGFLMQPRTAQAYSANTALGVSAGFVVGALLAKRWSPSENRVLRIAGAATAGGLLPWLGYAASNGGTSAEQWAGGLSVLGSLGGAWLGHYLTRHDAPAERFELMAASPAFVQRSGAGHWRLGVSAPRAVGRDVSSDAVTVFDLAAGRF